LSSFQSPPRSEQELLQLARNLAGKTFLQVARETGMALPPDPKRTKGWAGEIAEIYLGATAATLSEPDFQTIGVELKTLPLGKNGLPKESTYVCTVALTELPGQQWETSAVKRKLSRVLWLPVEADGAIAFARRRFGSAFLWSPDREQERILKNDWQELMEMVSMGRLDEVSSSHGDVLQIRPKAANAGALGKAFDSEGRASETLPRGFYLRTAFTRKILEQHKR
jgi:DNA mismatch repair protein MutH